MDPIVLAAGTALVGAIATDAWQQVKEAITGAWRRAHPGNAGLVSAELVSAELDTLREQVLRARSSGDQGTEHALEGAWQLRLQELVRASPAAAADLREILNQVLTPALDLAAQRRIGAIVMTGSSHDHSTFTQVGSQVTYRWS
jgi:hypothetical protein